MVETVSVVITCHNLVDFVADAIQSVLSQTGAPPLEVIVVDDASTDGSAAVISACPSVRLLQREHNGGALLATLTGIEASSGDILMLLDGDDTWEPDKIARTLDLFRADPTLVLATHDLMFVNRQGRPLRRTSRPAEVLAAAAAGARCGLIRDGLFQHRDYVWLGSALSLRRTLADLEGFCAWARALPEPGDTYQDWPLAYWAACQAGASFAYDPRVLMRYRLHGRNHSGDSATRPRALRNLARTRNTLQALEALGQRFGLDPATVSEITPKRRFAAYLAARYAGERDALDHHLGGLGGLLRTPGINRRKELARLALLSVFGVDGFITLTRLYKQ